MSRKLRDDQMATLVHTIQQPKSLVLSDPGAGKTPPICVNMWRRFQDKQIGTIWTQPKALMPKNKREIIAWTGFTEREVGILDGPKAKMDQVMALEPKVLLMGPDRFRRVWHQLPDRYRAHDVDELHVCFGGGASARTEAFHASKDQFEEGALMTGTLINGRWDSAWPAVHWIEPRYYPFGWEGFLADHAVATDQRGRPLAWGNGDKLRAIFGKHGIRFTFEQIFGKQPVVFELEWLAMNEKQRAIYTEFEEKALLELEDFFIDGSLPGVNLIRARQIMEHPNRFPDLRDPDHKLGLPPVDICPGERPAKLDALALHFEHHKQIGTPVIVFAALVPQMEEIAALARSMGLRVAPIMNGDATARQKDDADTGFVEGRYDVIVGSPPVCAFGYNWQFWGPALREVDHVIFASLTYMDSDFIQGYRRAIRRARGRPLRVTTMAYTDSADIKLMALVIRKSKQAHMVDPTREVVCFDSHEEYLEAA